MKRTKKHTEHMSKSTLVIIDIFPCFRTLHVLSICGFLPRASASNCTHTNISEKCTEAFLYSLREQPPSGCRAAIYLWPLVYTKQRVYSPARLRTVSVNNTLTRPINFALRKTSPARWPAKIRRCLKEIPQQQHVEVLRAHLFM